LKTTPLSIRKSSELIRVNLWLKIYRFKPKKRTRGKKMKTEKLLKWLSVPVSLGTFAALLWFERRRPLRDSVESTRANDRSDSSGISDSRRREPDSRHPIAQRARQNFDVISVIS